ncbi:hypothetical protein [Fimbriimonas ginsengisoli]|uniref:Uncharacterized protein n=1 Tax=Fimbriimonas ginsengisoli Gsoil 348 TaxID=661478 RepID=A0A068NT68_FIMGI|nr:hypothetical protein [Fimbriimonas ginsengisoli]AIE86532.1 hypothetical protein OP10G_3164 [Fimbriimonas ginsengisoli Gsoil 348]
MTSLILLAISQTGAASAAPPPLLGLRIGAEEAQVRAKLDKLGSSAKEEKEGREAEDEGEMVVWTLKSGPYQTAVVRFKKDRLTSLTAFVRPKASVPFSTIGSSKSAAVYRDHTAIWNVDAKPHPYRLVAKGPNGQANVVYMLSLER